MKNVSLLLVMMLSLIALNVSAQQSGDYFPGKWELLIQGTPQGDIKLPVSIERKDGKLEATIPSLDGGSSEVKITDIEEKEKSITIFFSTPDFDVDLYIEKVDDDNVKGSVANMFDIKGKRVKST